LIICFQCSNRSLAYATIKEYQKALDDASACIAIDEGWHKGYYRQHSALQGLGRLDDADQALERGPNLSVA
jgi:tetratricopeptide (TPR) repeat protein